MLRNLKMYRIYAIYLILEESIPLQKFTESHSVMVMKITKQTCNENDASSLLTVGSVYLWIDSWHVSAWQTSPYFYFFMCVMNFQIFPGIPLLEIHDIGIMISIHHLWQLFCSRRADTPCEHTILLHIVYL